ncbi:protein O-linked-mannose beta-1,2-N-acetylglucosaminyltransferase 1-like isoform X2 [Mya arenaria]|uniref:protein O-linked-mannose beta-1,2-N-acetylglucosaminyltransferase 1-like isoform X2 n=1 Tax=Mya arenaria TaxID=6604 RepID=UPI0022E3D23A|nr:protein O-linked-mannose beta-1,2-N-acetylglucosaminyltransferase 1-like isoform X2 [Mya arenaria]
MKMIRCKRKLGGKKLVLLVLLCCTAYYIGTIYVRTRGVKEIIEVSNYPNTTDGNCGPVCGEGQVSFYIKTGEENKNPPIVCVQRKKLIHSKLDSVYRGISMVLIDDKTMEVEIVKSYDTYTDDYEFLKDIAGKAKKGQVMFIASFDEMSESLSEEGRRWLKLFGAEKIDNVGFRDGYLYIGQKGLLQGYGIESVLKKKQGDRYAGIIEKMGCFDLPLGPVKSVEEVLPKLVMNIQVKLGDVMKNCGMVNSCPWKKFPVRVSTGEKDQVFPEICVNGRIVIGKDINGGGRGLNVVVVDPYTGTPKSASRYDTYEKDSLTLELYLETLSPGDIVILVAFDDGARKLTIHTRELLNKLGSSMAQNLQFRDVWYFVGQKGMQGFSKLEKISYAGMDGEWPKPLADSFCVASKVESSELIPDPVVYRNDVKRAFCKKYDGYADFCAAQHIDKWFLKPVKLIDEKLAQNEVYSSPILIVPGFNHNALVQTMETTIMQPGVKPDNVVVAWDEKFPEHAELADMFMFKNISISGTLEYSEHVIKAIDQVSRMFTKHKYLIVLEEELMLSPDFLYFLAQCTPALDQDDSLLGVSAFNYNGFENSGGNRSLLYRVEDFPGLGFMIKMDIVRNRMRSSLKDCCNVRSWNSWSLPLYNSSHYGYMLVPDVSRVFRQIYEGVNKDEDYLVRMFNSPRETNVERIATLVGVQNMTAKNYDGLIKELLTKALPINQSFIEDCSSTEQLISLGDKNKDYVLYFQQKTLNQYGVLDKVASCFALVFTDSHLPKNVYKGVIRVTVKSHRILLVGTKSPFAQMIPKGVKIFSGVR